MPQLSYGFNSPAAIEGLGAQEREAQVIISKLASGLVPVGKLCAPGTDSLVGPSMTGTSAAGTSPGQVIALPAGLVADPIADFNWTGLPMYESSRQAYDVTLGFSAFSDKDPVPVLIKGVIWVKPEGGVLPSEKFGVWVRTAAGAFPTLGAFANAAGAGLVAFPRGRWRSAVNPSTGLAILEVW